MSTPHNEVDAGIRAALDEAQFASLPDEEREARKQEYAAVAALWREYEAAREFDKAARSQYAIDRRYAAGTADPTWAVNTNLIGSHIDILTSFLYARNPDVSVKKTPRVYAPGIDTKTDDDFAKTMELVISSLWKKARLKRQGRKSVRSGLTIGAGWIKAVMVADNADQPQMMSEQNDIRDNVALLQALQTKLADADVNEMTPEDQDALIQEINELIQATQQRVEVFVRKYLAVDFCAGEDVQVSLDVREISDYLDASWVANAIYRPKDEIEKLFPRFQDPKYKDELKTAVAYHQRRVRSLEPVTDQVALDPAHGGADFSKDAEQYVQAVDGGEVGPCFVKIIELWDRRTNHIKTMIEGVKCWAKEPYAPPYPTSRFFPYFLVAFYEVDGARHPQSLPHRLYKLQDEYARSRSNFRLTRERSIPGTFVNGHGLDDEEVAKIEKSVHQEITVLKPSSPDAPLQNLIQEKPVPKLDPRVFDNSAILHDMEKVSGVQEALQTSSSVQKTATQADIEQQGFASRTTADRDVLETMLTDLANYTGELALSALDQADVQRIAGPAAYWPHGMDVDDLLTMVEIEIQAGTTGKPKSMGDREAWGVVLPILKETIAQIQEARAIGNEPLAVALTALLQETMVRMGDDTDVSRFIPEMPTLPAAPAPGPGGTAPSVGPDGLPLAPADAGGAAPSSPAPPELAAPALQPPPV